MKKIRILQFPIANSYGGITHYALENWKWLNKSRFQCDFVTMSKHLDFADKILETGSRIFYISCYAEEDREQFIKEFNKILDEGYDVVHLHTKQWKSFLVEEICHKRKIPKVIVHAHNTGIDTSDPIKRNKEVRLHENVKREFGKGLATDFWACSKLAADFLFGEQIPKNEIRIMHNAIELDKFIYNHVIRNEYRKNYGLDNSFVIGHVGRFVYQKNHEFLVRVFSEVLKIIDNARLILLGDGELCPEIRNQVKKLKIEDKVLFPGKRDDVNNWYQAMDVLCFPSRFEGLGIVLVEAQAAGLPCVISESFPEEVIIGHDIYQLPLREKEWIMKLSEMTNLTRKDNRMVLVEAGYDICDQIKVIEANYWGGGNLQ